MNIDKTQGINMKTNDVLTCSNEMFTQPSIGRMGCFINLLLKLRGLIEMCTCIYLKLKYSKTCAISMATLHANCMTTFPSNQ